MSLFVLDTDTLTHYYRGEATVIRRVAAHSTSELAISIVTVDQQLTGWYNVARQARQPEQVVRAYAQLGESIKRLARWRILPYTQLAILKVAHLKSLRLNVGLMDLRIGAITLENGATVVTCNRRDFSRIPGRTIEDWTT